MPRYRTLDEADIAGKRVIVRAGFDVPIEHGKVLDTERIEAILPTINRILEKGGSVVLLAHQGRPKGKRAMEFTQRPVADAVSRLLGRGVSFADDCIGPDIEKRSKELKPGHVLLAENLRFHPEEEQNDRSFAEKLAVLGDLYVQDAFTNSHREHASMVALAEILPSYAGLNLVNELEHLSKVHDDPRRPLVLIISGAKMETKIPIVRNFLDRGDDILLGGCVANTFLAARGFDVASSTHEPDFVEQCREIMLEADKTEKADVHIPRDAVVASAPSADVRSIDLPVEDIEGDMMILDIGKVTVERYCSVIEKAGMILWNGPMGFYEIPAFSSGTKHLADSIARATCAGTITIVGGGDTIDFHRRYGVPLDRYSFVSTGGGAMLDYVSGKPLPALVPLQR